MHVMQSVNYTDTTCALDWMASTLVRKSQFHQWRVNVFFYYFSSALMVDGSQVHWLLNNACCFFIIEMKKNQTQKWIQEIFCFQMPDCNMLLFDRGTIVPNGNIAIDVMGENPIKYIFVKFNKPFNCAIFPDKLMCQCIYRGFWTDILCYAHMQNEW